MSTYFVAGASRGIGLALVKQLLENYPGSKVIAGARSPTDNKELQELLSAHKDRLTLVKLDISSDASVKEAAEIIEKIHPEGIDFLINNGAVHHHPTYPDGSPDDLSYVFNTNTNGPLRVFHAVLPSIRKGKKKVVINISSSAGGFTMQDLLHSYGLMFGRLGHGYRVSKAALNLLTLSLSKQYAEEGITFVPVHPGEVDTDMMRAALGTNKQLIEEAAKLTVSPEVSVRSQLEVYHKLTFADSGKFINYKGESLPW